MKVLRTFQSLLIACFALLIFAFDQASAAPGPVAAPGAFEQFMERVTGAGKQTVDFSKNGTPVAAAGVPNVSTDGGMPKVEQTGTIKNPSGNPVNVKATGRVPKPQVAAAVGRALGKIIVPITYGKALWELCQELQYGCERVGDDVKFTKKDPEICTVGPCEEFGINNPSAQGGWHKTRNAACTSYIAAYNARGGTDQLAFVGLGEDKCHYSISYNGVLTWPDIAIGIGTRTTEPAPTNEVPATRQQFLDEIASKSGWPPGSAISEVISQSNTIGGEKLKPEGVTISGPTTSPGTTTTTNNTTNNTTKTETVTHNHTYEGDTVTTTTTTVINITNTTTGETISQETKTETLPPRKPDTEEAPVDSALPEVPKLYERKYPEGLEGVWKQQKAVLLATPIASLMGKLMPNIGMGGSCPTWNMDFAFATWADFGVRDVAPPCQVWDWGRVIILVSALLLARALIFGG